MTSFYSYNDVPFKFGCERLSSSEDMVESHISITCLSVPAVTLKIANLFLGHGTPVHDDPIPHQVS